MIGEPFDDGPPMALGAQPGDSVRWSDPDSGVVELHGIPSLANQHGVAKRAALLKTETFVADGSGRSLYDDDLSEGVAQDDVRAGSNA